MRYVIHASIPIFIHVDDQDETPVQRVVMADSVLNLPGLLHQVEAGDAFTQVVTLYESDSPVPKQDASKVIRLAEDHPDWPAWRWE